MSDTHDEPTPFGEGVGKAAGFILLLLIALVAAGWIYEGARWALAAMTPA